PPYSHCCRDLPVILTPSSDGYRTVTPSTIASVPITVQATDSQGCTGVCPTHTLHINCQTITVTNPGVNTAVAGSPFSATFTQSGAIGGATFSTSSTLPTGLTLSGAGALSRQPTRPGPLPGIV